MVTALGQHSSILNAFSKEDSLITAGAADGTAINVASLCFPRAIRHFPQAETPAWQTRVFEENGTPDEIWHGLDGVSMAVKPVKFQTDPLRRDRLALLSGL
jgi:hypothetical protein